MLLLFKNYKIFTCAQDILQNQSMAQFCSWRANRLYRVSVHKGLYFDVLEKKINTISKSSQVSVTMLAVIFLPVFLNKSVEA